MSDTQSVFKKDEPVRWQLDRAWWTITPDKVLCGMSLFKWLHILYQVQVWIDGRLSLCSLAYSHVFHPDFNIQFPETKLIKLGLFWYPNPMNTKLVRNQVYVGACKRYVTRKLLWPLRNNWVLRKRKTSSSPWMIQQSQASFRSLILTQHLCQTAWKAWIAVWRAEEENSMVQTKFDNWTKHTQIGSFFHLAISFFPFFM